MRISRGRARRTNRRGFLEDCPIEAATTARENLSAAARAWLRWVGKEPRIFFASPFDYHA